MKRSRLELLEALHLQLGPRGAARPGKNRECSLKDFKGKDLERFKQAIHKEINNNLGTGAYEILSPAESAQIRRNKPDKIMKSRYVFTCKPIEDFALEDAKSSDITLDFNASEGPTKAKCRHVMMGFSEPDLLSLETSTPQVHRDSVVFATHILASRGWQPGYADFTQAFHSGDAINRELYAELPREGIPGVEPTQLIKLKKTCYGLTDGPSAWFKHIVKYLTKELGYRQSIVDPDSIEGIVALATDDLLHGGSLTTYGTYGNTSTKVYPGKIYLGTRKICWQGLHTTT